jgi:uncharacterized membrane protein
MSTKRFTVCALALVAIVVALQLLMRERAPGEQPSVEAPPLARSAPPDQTEAPRAPPPQARAPRGEGAIETAVSGVVDAPPRAASDGPPAAADGSRRFIFDCGNGVTFAVRVVPGEATLFSPQALGAEAVRLPQVDDSGARYAENGVTYSTQGGLATFEIRERTFADCTSNPGAAETAAAGRRRATFRAHGNQPNWLLEISAENIGLALEGNRNVEFPYRAPTVTGTRTTYRSFVGTQELVVTIDAIPCNDTVSGERFESTTTVTFDGATLFGCGRVP